MNVDKAAAGRSAAADKRLAAVAADLRALQGLSLREAARRLNEKSVPAPRGGKWFPATVSRARCRLAWHEASAEVQRPEARRSGRKMDAAPRLRTRPTPSAPEGDAWLTAWDLARLTRAAKRTIDAARWRGVGPDYYVVRQRALYLRSEVWAWLASSRYRSTDEYRRKPAAVRRVWSGTGVVVGAK